MPRQLGSRAPLSAPERSRKGQRGSRKALWHGGWPSGPMYAPVQPQGAQHTTRRCHVSPLGSTETRRVDATSARLPRASERAGALPKGPERVQKSSVARGLALGANVCPRAASESTAHDASMPRQPLREHGDEARRCHVSSAPARL